MLNLILHILGRQTVVLRYSLAHKITCDEGTMVMRPLYLLSVLILRILTIKVNYVVLAALKSIKLACIMIINHHIYKFGQIILLFKFRILRVLGDLIHFSLMALYAACSANLSASLHLCLNLERVHKPFDDRANLFKTLTHLWYL